MNRRDLLRGAFAAAATGLLVPERRVWALDRTMLRSKTLYVPSVWHHAASEVPSEWFDGSMPEPLLKKGDIIRIDLTYDPQPWDIAIDVDRDGSFSYVLYDGSRWRGFR